MQLTADRLFVGLLNDSGARFPMDFDRRPNDLLRNFVFFHTPFPLRSSAFSASSAFNLVLSIAMQPGGEEGAEDVGPGLIGGDAHVGAALAFAAEADAIQEGVKLREIAGAQFRGAGQHVALLFEAVKFDRAAKGKGELVRVE